jgi:hypothetical protein
MNVYGFTARYAAGLVYDFYQLPGNEAGGPLHIVTDDDNLETYNVEWCLERAMKEQNAPAVVLAWILLQLSPTQRGKANRLATGG